MPYIIGNFMDGSQVVKQRTVRPTSSLEDGAMQAFLGKIGIVFHVFGAFMMLDFSTTIICAMARFLQFAEHVLSCSTWQHAHSVQDKNNDNTDQPNKP